MPTKEGECGRLRTGFEKVIAHRSTDLYAYTAKQDGVVLDLDDNLKMVKIKYKDGSVHAFSFAPQYGECSDMYTEQRQILTIKKGDRFKAHEVLRYNPQFFEADQDDIRQVNYKHGHFVNVAIVDTSLTFEDSNAISEALSKELEIAPVEQRMLTIQRDAVIHEIKGVGDNVDIADPLMTFELADTADLTGVTTDAMALEYLSKLNRTSPKAKVKGEIVDIKIFYACDLHEMHTSLAEAITKLSKKKQAVAKYVKDTNSVYNFAGASKVPLGSRYKGVTIDENTVIFQYLIRQVLDHQAGDKMVIDSSLKTVSCHVIPDPPTTENGEVVDVLFSATSISNRIVNSPILVGISEKVLTTLEKRVVDLYFGE